MSTKDESSPNAPDKSAVATTPDFPVANIVATDRGTSSIMQSKMWWITLSCLLLAVWLAWSSQPETGPEISIHFPEGHGLRAGDAVRYRGIDVGVITAIALNDTLSGVDVQVMLKPEGGRLDREGTRFWIVRPQLSLTKVSGLETAVGAKYIGVSPGDNAGQHVTVFDGLAAPPPDELESGGLQLVLRSDDRHGLNAGAPVTWRGVEVGQVLSVNLSPGAGHVLTSVRINSGYRRLVREGSKFWVTSGFGVDVSLTGMKLSAQSLSTIVRGGISFITPVSDSNDRVQDGQVFALVKEPNEDWLKKASGVALIDFPLPTTVTIQYTQKTSFLGISRTREFTQTGLLIDDGRKKEILTAAVPDSVDEPDRIETVSRIRAGTDPVVVGTSLKSDCLTTASGMMKIRTDYGLDDPATSPQAVRQPDSPEECLIVRTAGTYNEPVVLVQAIDIEQLAEDKGVWKIVDVDEDLSVWHGAPVVSTNDGKIIALLLNREKAPVIAPFTDQWQAIDE